MTALVFVEPLDLSGIGPVGHFGPEYTSLALQRKFLIAGATEKSARRLLLENFVSLSLPQFVQNPCRSTHPSVRTRAF
jgi:hypothetical protein